MSKNKRTLTSVASAQQVTEKNAIDKFSSVQEEFKVKDQKQIPKRISPKISCTVDIEDKEALDALTLFISTQAKRVINTSIVMRKLIRLGMKHKQDLV